MFKVYIWMEGPEFDPEEFNNSLKPELKGHVRIRKRINKNFPDMPMSSWRSEYIEIASPYPEYPEDKLAELLKKYRSTLLPIVGTKGIQIWAEIVAQYETPEEVGGYFFSAQTIQYLAELKACLDIDVYVDYE